MPKETYGDYNVELGVHIFHWAGFNNDVLIRIIGNIHDNPALMEDKKHE
jgi:hypothetical protein